MRLLGGFIELLARRQNGRIFAAMPLTGRDVADGAVAVFLVVPLHESMDPSRAAVRLLNGWLG